MLMSERHSDTASFPHISEGTKARFCLSDLSLRPFGLLGEDLEINFNQTSRLYLETQILACCIRDCNGARLDRSFFWSLEVGKRIECLLTLATLRDGSNLSVDLRCPHPACQRRMAIEIAMQELTNLQQQAADSRITGIAIGNEKFSIRRPTGADQLSWLSHSFPDDNSAVQAMLQTLLPEEQKSVFHQVWGGRDQWMPTLNQAMEDMDPLVNFSLQVNCPYCGAQGLHALDLGAWSLQKLHRAQRQLIETVHRLASHYHWSEQEILSFLPGDVVVI